MKPNPGSPDSSFAHNQSRRRFISSVAILGAAAAAGGAWYWSKNRRGGNNLVPRIALQSPWVNDAEFIGYFVAIHEKLYQEAGLDFTYLPGGPDVIADAAVLAEKADIALAPVETVASLVAKQNAPLKIIGTQYQKSPLGVVSLKESSINRPADLAGKTLAVPAANVLTAQAFLEINQVPKDQVKIVPYQYDPTPLINKQVDATLDFVTNVPYSIRQKGAEPNSFLLYDFGFRVYNDVVVVTEKTLRDRPADLKAWMQTSRAGWQKNFADIEKYPQILAESFFKGTGRTTENEIFFNRAQKPLIEAEGGIFTMTQQGITDNVATLAKIGLSVSPSLFDSSIARS